MNPFQMKSVPIDRTIQDWCQLYPKSYDKNETDPYTKCRIILMNGTEFEAVWFSHQFHRHCTNNDLRRELALSRRIEQQQQKKISNLKPINETILEQTISYEQLAVDLTAALAKMEQDAHVKAAMDFALLEDFDHLYRYANLLEMESGVLAEKLVGGYTELMPGRPTIAHHRYPFEAVNHDTNFKKACLQTQLNVSIITAAEQQTMNYYMNQSAFYTSDLGRRLYQEIGMVEEQHVSEYGSLMDTTSTWLESLLLHEYTECYLYYSCCQTETHPYVKQIWEQCFEQELAHLHKAVQLLQKYEGKDWCQVIPNGEFPSVLKLGSNIEYVREVLGATVNVTKCLENYVCVDQLPPNADFFRYQNIVNRDVNTEPGHNVIEASIAKNGMDYRYETAPNPIPALRDRTQDNTCVGR